MQNTNQRISRHASPGRDPVVLVMKAAAAVLALAIVILGAQLAHRETAMAGLHCPAPDHAVWASSLGPWWWQGMAICGDSLTAGVTAR